MKKSSILWGIIVIAIIAIVIVVGMREQDKPQAHIRLGAVLGLTGYAADDSMGVKRGVDLAVADLARKGVTVEVRYEDDKTDPKQTVSALQYMIATYKPQAVIGPIWSFLEDAGAPILTQHRLVGYAPADTTEFTMGGPYMLHGAVKNELIAEPAAGWLRDKKISKVAIIVGKDGFGSSVAKAFRNAAFQAGTKVVFDDAILGNGESGATMSTYLSKAKAAGAEAVLFTGYDEEAVVLAQRRPQIGFNVPVLAHTREYQRLLSGGTISESDVRGIDYISAENSPEFVAKFKAVYGQEPGNYSERAYDGAMMLVAAIQNATSTDGETLTAYIRSHPYQGYAGTYRFDQKGDLVGGGWIIHPVVK